MAAVSVLSEIGFQIIKASILLGFAVFVCWFTMPMDPRPYYRGSRLAVCQLVYWCCCAVAMGTWP